MCIRDRSAGTVNALVAEAKEALDPAVLTLESIRALGRLADTVAL